MLDIDHFKRVNDRYGHAAGDAVLQTLAALLRQSVRDTEIVARYGGEEFALLMPLTNTDEADAAAERIRQTVASHSFLTPQGKTLPLTISVGVASFPTDCRTLSDLVEAADKALYAAKNNGRNQVCRA
jgi:diguanylate cyclase (GGDEF)-like protein